MSLELVAGLLAFIVAAYTLLIQTKKSQTAIETILNLLLLACFATVGYSAFLLVEHIAAPIAQYPHVSRQPNWKAIGLIVGSLLQLGLSCALVLLILQDISIQFFYRIDRLVIWRRFRYFRERRNGHYRDSKPHTIREDEVKPIFEQFFYHKPTDDWYFLQRAKDFSQSLSVLATKGERKIHHEEVAALILHCLEEIPNSFVEYVSCTRHPIEVINDMAMVKARQDRAKTGRDREMSGPTSDEIAAAKKKLQTQENRKRFIMIDAHTPHFGFGEPVYYAKSREAKAYALEVVRSGKSFPGLHTALVKGFSRVKDWERSSGSASRSGRLGVIIFDDLSALADVDSVEQLRLFVRHVVASEHLMGGILTVMYESKAAIDAVPFLPEIVDWHFDCHKKMDVAFPPWELRHGVRTVAKEIAEAVAGLAEGDKVLLLPVMNGGIAFADSVIDALKARFDTEAEPNGFDARFDRGTITATKYGRGTSGKKRAVVKTTVPAEQVQDRVVILLDDICHTGDTLRVLKRHLKDIGAREVWTAVAIQRCEAHDMRPEFYALSYQRKYPTLDNAWMYGYGMDDEGDPQSRLLPYLVFSKRA